MFQFYFSLCFATHLHTFNYNFVSFFLLYQSAKSSWRTNKCFFWFRIFLFPICRLVLFSPQYYSEKNALCRQIFLVIRTQHRLLPNYHCAFLFHVCICLLLCCKGQLNRSLGPAATISINSTWKMKNYIAMDCDHFTYEFSFVKCWRKFFCLVAWRVRANKTNIFNINRYR